MAKQTNSAVKQNAVVKAISDAIEKSRTLGEELVTNFVTIARKHYGGKPIEKAEQDAILDRIHEQQGWSDKSAKVRKSEIRRLLEHYTLLPELVKVYREKTGSCTWHDVVRLARTVASKSGKTRVRQAVNALVEKSKASTVAPNKLSRGDAKAAAAKSIKRILKMTKIEPGFRAALEELCGEYRINV